jgi:thioesterase domain-containing protein
LVALEMARQLHAAGEEVALLAALDAGPSSRDLSREAREAEGDGVPALYRWATDLLREHNPLDLDELRRLGDFDRQLDYALDAAHRAGLSGVIADHLPQLEALRRYHRVLAANQRALDAYRPLPYAGPVILLRAEAGLRLRGADPTLGWSAIAADLTILDVPGNHDNMIERPYVRIVAGVLGRCLERAGGPLCRGEISASASELAIAVAKDQTVLEREPG